MIKVCIVGAGGRMGKNIAIAVYNDPDVEVAGAVDRGDSPAIGANIYEIAGVSKGGAAICGSLVDAAKNSDVIIDFTGAPITMSNLPEYKKIGKPIVIGSTGFSAQEKAEISSLAKTCPVLLAANMSLGVNVALKLVTMAASALQGYDIEVLETHHNKKKDSPSGTALILAEAAAKGAKLDLDKNAVYARHGLIGERKPGEIGIQTLRGGDVVGDHTVFFFGDGERLEITHKAESRMTFAHGAVRAAKWISGKPSGLYGMDDVLF